MKINTPRESIKKVLFSNLFFEQVIFFLYLNIISELRVSSNMIYHELKTVTDWVIGSYIDVLKDATSRFKSLEYSNLILL